MLSLYNYTQVWTILFLKKKNKQKKTTDVRFTKQRFVYSNEMSGASY